MQNIGTNLISGAAVPAFAAPRIGRISDKFVDSCSWEQILKILQENGFGESARSDAPVHTMDRDGENGVVIINEL